MEGLRQKLENQGLNNVVYMVVNHQGEQAQRLHAMLGMRLSENITLYKQDAQQPDVWQTLGGEKDDFFIYDRFVTCSGYLIHISRLLMCFLFNFYSPFFSVFLPSGVAVSPITFHFHTALLDKAMWRVPSKIRTASACVASARMRYRPDITAKRLNILLCLCER